MSLTRRQLPIASPCQEFVGRVATATTPAFCTRCEKSVHDLSRMTEAEVITLLAKNLGGRVCVSYRAKTDGSIATRRPVSRFAPAAIAASLAGCAGHVSEAERASADCIDENGYDTACPPKPRLADAVIPDVIDEPAIDRPATIDPPRVPDAIAEDPNEPTALYPDVEEEEEEEEEQVAGGVELEVERGEMLAGKPVLHPSLRRRVEREAKRLQRAEARRERRLARR
jgi:hypothetical protein